MLDLDTLYVNHISGEAQSGRDWLDDYALVKSEITFEEWAPEGLDVVQRPEMTKEVIERAKKEFISVNGKGCVPKQLNLRCHYTDGWEAEFLSIAGMYTEGFILWTDEGIENIFHDLDLKELKKSIEMAWDDSYFDITQR